MADEQPIEVNAGEVAPVPAEPVPATPPGDENAFKWLSFLFIGLSALGVFSYGAENPRPGLLALGFLGWGVLDLLNQAKALRHWAGSQSAANLLNISRAVFLLGLGSLLALQAFGRVRAFGSNTLLIIGVSFLAAYLLSAYVLELATKSRDTFSHALLLGAFGVGFFSFFCFSILFSVPWTAVLGGVSMIIASWAIYRGVLNTKPSLAPSVALVTMLLALPFGVFMTREVISKNLQPVHQASIFVPRFHELKGPLSRESKDLAWSPGHTQAGQPGDIPYSDKIAYVDHRDGKDFLSVYGSHDEGGALTERPMADIHGKHWWSPNANLLAVSEVNAKTHKRVLLALELDPHVFEKNGERLFHFKSMTISSQNVAPQDTHGQIFSPDAKTLYFAGPNSMPTNGNSQIWSARLDEKNSKALTGLPYKTFPAAAPDGSKLAFVGFKQNIRYLEIGDGVNGKNSRLFNYKTERALFPAWNAIQTQVLYLDPADILKIMSANNKADATDFSSGHLNSRLWKTEKGEFFTLDKRDTGDIWQIYTMNPGGGENRLIYEVNGSEVMPPMWSSDSKRIAFIEHNDTRFTIYTVGRDGDWPRRVFVTHDPIRELRWCPDAQRLAWFCDRAEGAQQELWVAEKESLNPVLAYESSGELQSLSWSPEGEHIAFEEKWAFEIAGIRVIRPDLYSTNVLDIKDREVRSMTSGGLFARMPAFSPQGDMLAFLTEQRSFPGLPGNWSLKPATRRPAALAVAQLY